jgi:hypothetical protein
VTGLGRCDYRERNNHCRQDAAYEVQFDGRKVRLCVRHSRPEFHPPDLHKKLPGIIRRAFGARDSQIHDPGKCSLPDVEPGLCVHGIRSRDSQWYPHTE